VPKVCLQIGENWVKNSSVSGYSFLVGGVSIKIPGGEGKNENLSLELS